MCGPNEEEGNHPCNTITGTVLGKIVPWRTRPPVCAQENITKILGPENIPEVLVYNYYARSAIHGVVGA